ncbi:Scr1 family TA system antitoxin-like transcriptional regulator [Streptomyces sp. NPDC087425]|uniref:Scr1 family TA system antitoxin-like transcriptional regulator n=1 Tax=Streptomyces sp. NPDC087425 TaxID=3365787 RepID=UPI00382FF572
MTERTGAAEEPEASPTGGNGTALNFGDSWEDSDEGGQQPVDDAGRKVLVAFGKTMKTLRIRAGLERPEFGKRIGYSAGTVASYEQGRRIPDGRTIDKADEVADAQGLLTLWKEQVERAQYPATFEGLTALEKKAIELLMYDTLTFNGLLQTEEYMRALLIMRRPMLDPETIEQRVTARLARQEIFDRWPAPFLSFVIDESVLRRPYGGKAVLRGQLEHVLLIGQKRNVEIQVMPLDCEDNASASGPFILITQQNDAKRFVYSEVAGVHSTQTDPELAVIYHARYGIIRSQALPPRESMQLIEGVLGSL